MAWEEFFIPSGGGVLKRQLFTSNGTWTKPEKLVGGQVWVTMIGGGGSGNVSSSSSGVFGGRSGEMWIRQPVNVANETSVAVTIGDGGAAVVSPGVDTNGNSGSPSSFGSLLSAPGGLGGGFEPYSAPRSNTGNAVHMQGGDFIAPSNLATAVDTRSCAGPGLALDGNFPTTANGTRTPGYGASGYGCGGAGAYATNEAGSAGAPGAVMVEWIESV